MKLLEKMKYTVTVFIPALSVLIFTLSQLFGLKTEGAIITTIIGAIGVFLGQLIGVYNLEGKIDTEEEDKAEEDIE